MSEQSNFENEWRSVFDGAVDQPSSNVWVGVKSELAAMNAENQKKKY